jgi:hypothetical protein
MKLTRTAFALFGSLALAGTSAMAQSINIGAGAQVNAGAHVGVPPVNVPPVSAPPVSAPPVNAPPVNAPPVKAPPVSAPRANTNANANASLRVNASSQSDADGILKGTLTSVTGSNVSIRTSNGSTQNYAVSASTAQDLQSSVGKPIAYRLQNGSLVLAGHEGNQPLHGTLESLTGSTAVIQLPNGTTQTYTVNAQQSTLLKGRVGKSIVFWSGTSGALELNQKHPSNHKSP